MTPSALLLCVLLTLTLQADQGETVRAKMHSYLEAEAARQKAGFCKTAHDTYSINECDAAEMEKTKANYLGFIRALGLYLRLTSDVHQYAGKIQHIPFDDAESAWLSYSRKTCDIARQRFKGGTGAPDAYATCYLTLTGNHMQELAAIFSDNS